MMRIAAFSSFPDNPGFARFGSFAGVPSQSRGKPKAMPSMACCIPGKPNGPECCGKQHPALTDNAKGPRHG